MGDPGYVLLVEDDESHRELAARAFLSSGDCPETRIVGSFREAVESIASERPCLVIADMMLPDGRGVDLIAPADDDGGRPYPLVVMTSYGDERMAVAALKAGAQDYIVKTLEAINDLPHIADRALREWDNQRSRRKAERLLEASERRFKAAFDQAFQYSWLVTGDGSVIAANRGAMAFAGLGDDEEAPGILDPRWWGGRRGAGDLLGESIREAARGAASGAVVEAPDSGGRERTLELSIKPVDDGGPVPLVLIEGRDETERRAAEAAIATSLAEKNELLREVHHRVKNNLQVMESLLRIQREGISDEDARRVYDNSVLRIRAMASIHDLLYQSEDFSRVDLAEYLRELAADLGSGAAAGIRVRVESASVELSMEQAVPCGLIASEALSNALRHAYPDGGPGEIRIRLAESPGDIVELDVEDDGQGIGDGAARASSSSLGLYLASILAEQLGGTVELRERAGAGSGSDEAGGAVAGGAGALFRLRFARKAPASGTRGPG